MGGSIIAWNKYLLFTKGAICKEITQKHEVT